MLAIEVFVFKPTKDGFNVRLQYTQPF